MYTLTQTLNLVQAYAQYAPFTAGLGQEPAISVANLIRSTLTNAPMTWSWNRATFTLASQTVSGTQDYTVPISSIPDFGFLEKVNLTDSTGKIWEVKDIYNNGAMPAIGTPDTVRPNAACVLTLNSTNLVLRFVGVPDAAYTVILIYQKRPILFGPYIISSAANHSGANTAYTGTFDPLAFPTGATAQITGFQTNAVNNGAFVVVSCTSTTLTVANGSGISETITAYANNFDWTPIPDSYLDIYNNLFLSEMLAISQDVQLAQVYRQRGVAAFLAKAEGLSEMQKNAFLQQWLARSVETTTVAQMAQLGNQGRGV